MGMATPLTPDQMLKALRAEGVKVVEHRAWDTHNRNHVGPWGPVHGVMIHHTVTGADVASTVALCYDGHSELPGPLCHAVGGKDGLVYLVSNGRANHAGKGDPDVLAAVEREAAVLPADNSATVDGNRYFYGIEIQNRGDGRDPYPDAQYLQAVKYAAALCRAHGWSERSVIGHKEWQPGKIDPSFSMDDFRNAVRILLRNAPRPKPVPAPTLGRTMRYTSLAVTDAPETIAAGASKTIYWDAEYQDGSGDHGAGGKTILSGEHYTGTVSLLFAAPVPPGIIVQMVQELDSGGSSGEPQAQLVSGLITHAFPVTGRVPEDRNLVFVVHNDSTESVVLEWAGVRLFTEAL